MNPALYVVRTHGIFFVLIVFFCIGHGAEAQVLATKEKFVSCTTAVAKAAQCGVVEQCLVYDPKVYSADSFYRLFDDLGSCQKQIYSGLTAIGCAGSKSNYCSYELNGEITKAQVEAFERFLKTAAVERGRRNFGFQVSSNGGDVEAAIRLGTLLRERTASVSIPPNGTCASACVLVLAGGVVRSVEGPVVIHRPFRAAAQVLGAQQAQRRYEERNTLIAGYLQRMNIPVSLLDAMLEVPSEDGRVLSRSELNKYGLSQTDPVYQEERDGAYP